MNKLITRTIFLLLLHSVTLRAQVPQLINYQGRVAVGSTNFTGNGQFRFALVNADGNITYWSNDGTSTAGSEPAAAVTLTVTKGLYSVLLGDASVVNMIAIPISVFNNSDVRLRVWFNDGPNGSQRLTPDQRLSAVGYAMMAGNVPDGTITGAKIAANSVNGTHLANGSVGSVQLAAGVVQASNIAPGAVAANLNSSGQSGVANGGIVLSAMENPALVSAGYVRIGTVHTGDGWQQRDHGSAPAERYGHTAVWTGSEMIVWGGQGDDIAYLNDGGRYNPVANSWTAMSIAGAPSGRADHTAVWTGSRMIIWGGANPGGYHGDGAQYDPTGDSWTPVTTTIAPAARRYHTAIWTGSEMIVWGGNYYDGNFHVLNDGGRYNPTGNSWTAMTTTGAPAARFNHTAVWTGSEMMVWGGSGGTGNLNDGARYRPGLDNWTGMTPAGAPAGRAGHTAVWTGSEMIVWGGLSDDGFNPDGGGRYRPGLDNWTHMTTAGAPAGRFRHTAVWTGNEMIVWGGYNGEQLNDGGRFDLQTSGWTAVSTMSPPIGRQWHTAVWTGSEMIVWGGTYNDGDHHFLNDTSSYTLGRVLHLYQRP